MGKIFENLFKNPQSQTKVQIYWQGDLMAIKKSNVACVFIGKLLANMTQVSDVAPGPLVVESYDFTATPLHYDMLKQFCV
jgi:hypothetical protein